MQKSVSRRSSSPRYPTCTGLRTVSGGRRRQRAETAGGVRSGSAERGGRSRSCAGLLRGSGNETVLNKYLVIRPPGGRDESSTFTERPDRLWHDDLPQVVGDSKQRSDAEPSPGGAAGAGPSPKNRCFILTNAKADSARHPRTKTSDARGSDSETQLPIGKELFVSDGSVRPACPPSPCGADRIVQPTLRSMVGVLDGRPSRPGAPGLTAWNRQCRW